MNTLFERATDMEQPDMFGNPRYTSWKSADAWRHRSVITDWMYDGEIMEKGYSFCKYKYIIRLDNKENYEFSIDLAPDKEGTESTVIKITGLNPFVLRQWYIDPRELEHMEEYLEENFKKYEVQIPDDLKAHIASKIEKYIREYGDLNSLM